MNISHNIAPVYDSSSKILILGTLPSPKSRELGFYYGHPKNRFWPVMSELFHVNIGCSIQQKIDFLLYNNIALWDVLESCDITGAADSSIKNPVANDFTVIFETAAISKVYTTGTTAGKLYTKLVRKPCTILPSTSPANCRVSFQQLLEAYAVILNDLI